MNGISILKILNAIVVGYIFVLIFRVLLSWFSSPQIQGSREFRLLHKITEPYLRLFRKIPLFQNGRIDFSPIVAILSLQFVSYFLMNLILTGTITLVSILLFLIQALWSVLSFLLIFFLALFAIRLIVLYLGRYASSRIIMTIDNIINPVIAWFNVKFFKGRIVQYRVSLLICTSILVVLLVSGHFLTNLLIDLLL